jgi:hypothetical protein
MPTVTKRTHFKEESIRRRTENISNLASAARKKQMEKPCRKVLAKYHPDKKRDGALSNQKTQLVP